MFEKHSLNFKIFQLKSKTLITICLKLFEAPSVNKTMNLEDLCDPGSDYNSLLDPGLQKYLNNPRIREHLIKSGQITESGRIVCTLKELNAYRRHLARKQARAVQMTLKAEVIFLMVKISFILSST